MRIPMINGFHPFSDYSSAHALQLWGCTPALSPLQFCQQFLADWLKFRSALMTHQFMSFALKDNSYTTEMGHVPACMAATEACHL